MSFTRIALLVFASCVLATNASAQTELVPPPNAPYGLAISPEDAKKVAAAAIAETKSNGWSMAISVVDTGGYLVYFERMPDTQLGSVQVSLDKARSAALFRRSTKAFLDTLAGEGAGLRMLALSGAVPVEGGIPLILDGKVVGAIGASGGSGEQDGQTAQAGAAALAEN